MGRIGVLLFLGVHKGVPTPQKPTFGTLRIILLAKLLSVPSNPWIFISWMIILLSSLLGVIGTFTVSINHPDLQGLQEIRD